ncbi:hypothetical protein [Fulvivirga sp.]|uniref:hypothetical protein n=1 Tax=Fulvivirga sp. TaxID=1931237 RepID=UPI0032EFE480
MFFSLKYEGFNKEYPELVKFILNKDARYLPDHIKVYCYFNLEGALRNNSNSIIGDFSSGKMKVMNIGELTFPPLGFVLSIDSEKPDKRLTDISHFANYRYNDWTDFYQKLTVLPTHLPYLPGDYRTKEEIIEAISKSKKIN